jgi:hypothetical protein
MRKFMLRDGSELTGFSGKLIAQLVWNTNLLLPVKGFFFLFFWYTSLCSPAFLPYQLLAFI